MNLEIKIRLYMNGVKYNEYGVEEEYVEVEETQRFALYAMGWRMDEDNDLFDDNLDM